MTTVIRSKTGVYHLGTTNSSHCNGRSGKFNPAKSSDVEKANETSFCKKCFPNGNPRGMIERMISKGILSL